MNRLVIVLLILIFGFFTRAYALGTIPSGLAWDEAAIGYNGYAIFTTRRDEWLNRLPISFRSFGDYKAPLSIYINGFTTYAFGLNAFAVRLPFFLFSQIAILGMYYLLSQHIFPKKYSIQVFLLISIVLSPWHFHFSRVAFESGIALSLFILSLYCFFNWSKAATKNRTYWLIISGILAILTLYTYHSSKVAIPLLFMVLLFWNRKKLILKDVLISTPILLILLYPLIQDSFFGSGLQRAQSTVFAAMPFMSALQYTIYNFFEYFHPRFIIFGQVDSLRHGIGEVGILSYLNGFLFYEGVLLGFLQIITKNSNFFPDSKLLNVFKIGILIIIVGILPAAIGTEVHHANRALLSFPGFIMIAGYAAITLINSTLSIPALKVISGSHGEKGIVKNSIIGSLILFEILLGINNLHLYFLNYREKTTAIFLEGYVDAFKIAEKYEKGFDNYQKVDQILFSAKYGQPYIYALFARETNPIYYQGGSLNKYLFTDSISASDYERPNTLVVSTPQDVIDTSKTPVHVIYGSDNSIRFYFFINEKLATTHHE